MMQLWRWIQGRAGRATLLGFAVLVGFSGCRSGGSFASRGYAPAVHSGPAAVPLAPQAVPPYEEPTPILNPPLKTQSKLDTQLGEAAEPQEFVGTPTEPAKAALPKVEAPQVDAPQPAVVATETPITRDVFADEPLPPAPKTAAVDEPKADQPKEVAKPVAQDVEPLIPVQPRNPKVVAVDEPAVPESKPVTEVTKDTEKTKPLFEPARKPTTNALSNDAKDDEPFVPEFKPEPPKSDAPKAETSKPEKAVDVKTLPNGDDEEAIPAPKVDARKADAPSVDAAKVAAPLIDVPLPDVPLPSVPNAKSVDQEPMKDAAPQTGREKAQLDEPRLDKEAVAKTEPMPTLKVEPPKITEKNNKSEVGKDDPLSGLDPFEPESFTPVTPLPEKSKNEKKTDIAASKIDALPEISPTPIAKAISKPVTKELPLESGDAPQVAGRISKDPQVSKTPDAPAPGALSDANSSLPLRAPVRISDLAEFDQPADHLLALDDGSVLVSHRTSVSRIKADGRIETFSRPGSPRGMVSTGTGFALCDASQRAVVKLDSHGLVTEKLAVKSDGYFLRAPKDVAADANGGLYFTDPGYARIKNPIGQIHYLSTSGKVSVVAQKLAYPDGLALSPDGSRLYVVEGQEDQVLSFDLLSAGKVGPKRVFAKLPVDGKKDEGSATGIAVDQRGRVYVAQRDQSKIQVIDPDGRMLTSYQCGTLLLTDIAVVQGDRNQLLVAGSSGSENGRGKILLLELSGR